MKEFDRRTVLRYSGVAAAGLMLRGERFAYGQDSPIATTAAGKVSGRVENGINVFRGIPYGEDTRKTRFKKHGCGLAAPETARSKISEPG